MGNTFVSVQRSGPQDRNFGTIEIWMIGTQIPIGNNLYSLLYIACLQQEAIDGWKDSHVSSLFGKVESVIDQQAAKVAQLGNEIGELAGNNEAPVEQEQVNPSI